MKVGIYTVWWKHQVYRRTSPSNNLRKTVNGRQVTIVEAISTCSIQKEGMEFPSARGSYIHKPNKFDRKNGVLQAFKMAVCMCPVKSIRKELWDAFWAIRKPTVVVTEEAADLVDCTDYVACKVKELIIKDDPLGYNEGWREMSRAETVKRLSNRLGMYRDKSDHSLITIIKLCIIGFINYKRTKDATIQNSSDKQSG